MKSIRGEKYLIPQQLISKIKDELYIRGGRVSIVDLGRELNLDLNQMNPYISEIVKGNEVQLVAEILIAHYYLEEIALEINIKLQTEGTISVGDLTLQFDLSADVLQHYVLEKYLGTKIIGKQDPFDPTLFYTEEYITRITAKIRGALMGLVKPTYLHDITNYCKLKEDLFLYIFEQLNDTGAITDHDNPHAWTLYEPFIHIKSQNDSYIRSYKMNNYFQYFTLEFDFVPYCPKEYIKRILPNENMIFLKGCVIDFQLKQKLEAAVENCIVSKNYLNVSSFLNVDVYAEDIETLLNPLLKKYNSSTIVIDNTVFSYEFIESIKQACIPMVQKQAESVVKFVKFHHYLEDQLATIETQNNAMYEENRKNASSSREAVSLQDETEIDGVNKHLTSHELGKGLVSDETPIAKEKNNIVDIINIQDIENVIKDIFGDEYMDHVVTPIAENIQGYVNQTAFKIVKELSEKLLQDEQSTILNRIKINDLICDIKLYEKGLKLFPIDQRPEFIKYLLKSLGGDVLSEFCKYTSKLCSLSIPTDILSDEQRNKIIKGLSDEYKKPLHTLNAVLAEQNMKNFYQAVDVCLLECGIDLEKINKKNKRLLVQNHREKLISEMKICQEPAQVLNLVVSVLFTVVTQNILHASGRQVPLIILFLKPQLKEDDFDKVQKYHEMVEIYATAADEEKEKTYKKLKEDLPLLISVVTKVKKYM